MTVSDIYTAVRCCIDEEPVNASHLDGASAFDFDDQTTDIGLMNDIIKNKIPAALRWVTLYAPSDALSGGSSDGESESESDTTIDIIHEEDLEASDNLLEPTYNPIRVVRVKGGGWHRAILGDTLIKEDSDEYLQLSDEHGAAATEERPQAALRNTKKKGVEVYPAEDGDTFTLTYIRSLTAEEIDELEGDTEVSLPALVETSFIYYLAYLLCCAYGDGRAKSMFEIATMNLGRTDDKQRQ